MCSTTLFNTHWTCLQCGFTVCIDCFSTALKCGHTINTSQSLDNQDLTCLTCITGSARWLTCTAAGNSAHRPTDLVMTQIIPSDGTWTILFHHTAVLYVGYVVDFIKKLILFDQTEPIIRMANLQIRLKFRLRLKIRPSPNEMAAKPNQKRQNCYVKITILIFAINDDSKPPVLFIHLSI